MKGLNTARALYIKYDSPEVREVVDFAEDQICARA
jgi:hypothetical protein